FKQKNRAYLIYNTLNNYHEQNILNHYPTANIKDLKANQKEALSKIISYYGDSLSYDRLADLADKQVVNKYSYTEQKYGIQQQYTDNIKELKAKIREALYKIISYYGDSLSYDRLADLADKQVVNKYSYTEQKYGIQLLYKIENNKLTDDDRLEIKSDYRKQEI